ncbi:MAG TPA: hypothetical protein VLF79_01715 [Candidatus Saccharimonadales bacterium]|nr:hypothetical protein [Candidatus Saccharimonadales bacterium]
MSDPETQQALEAVVPGKLLKDIHFSAGHVIIKGLREGIVPDSSPLADPSTHVFVATNSEAAIGSANPAEVAVAIREEEDNIATIQLAPIKESAAGNVRFLREVITASMAQEDIPGVRIDRNSSVVSESILEGIGFHALSDASQQDVMEYRLVA